MGDKPHIEESAPRMKDRHNAWHILLDYLYTIIISVLIAVFLTIIGIQNRFQSILSCLLSFGISICTLIVLLFWLFKSGTDKDLVNTSHNDSRRRGRMVIGSHLGPFILRRFVSVNNQHARWPSSSDRALALVFGGTVAYSFIPGSVEVRQGSRGKGEGQSPRE